MGFSTGELDVFVVVVVGDSALKIRDPAAELGSGCLMDLSLLCIRGFR